LNVQSLIAASDSAYPPIAAASAPASCRSVTTAVTETRC
jgi:hypothetical protein